MEQETVWKKIKRLFTGEVNREQEIVHGMSSDAKTVMTILILVIVAVVIVASIVYSALLHAAPNKEPEYIDVSCPVGTDVCTIKRTDLIEMVRSNAAAKAVIDKLKASQKNCLGTT